MKKLALFLTSIVLAIAPISAMALKPNSQTGPRGGTFVPTANGNKEYFGNNSNYSHDHSSAGIPGWSIALIVIGAIIFIAFLLFFGMGAYRNRWKESDVRDISHLIKPLKNPGVSYAPKKLEELESFKIGFIGGFKIGEKEEMVSLLKEKNIDVSLLSRKDTSLWITGSIPTDKDDILKVIRPLDKVTKVIYITHIVNRIKKEVTDQAYMLKRSKELKPIDATTHPHLYATKEREDLINSKSASERRMYIRKCTNCSSSFKTLVEKRTLCKKCR